LARTWLSIQVDLVEGHGEQYWPRPGRIFAAARGHTFKQLADAIDDSFARWDGSHLQEFTLADKTRLCDPDPDWEIDGEITGDYRKIRLSRLRPGEHFVYVFDLGDDWAHLCTVGAQRIDPVRVLGILPDTPCHTGAGATFPTSTGAAGMATTASHHSPMIPGSLICHRSGPTGEPAATRPDEGSPPFSQEQASPAITRLGAANRLLCGGLPPGHHSAGHTQNVQLGRGPVR